MSELRFSVVIPTKNEAADIAGTTRALERMDPPPWEIIVVDSSCDGTAEIVQGLGSARTQVIHQLRGGRCEARNEGIRRASGDVVVILNADVHLPADFLGRLEASYERGADYVLVGSLVENSQSLFGRFVQALHETSYTLDTMKWTEGFSVRREVALAAGLFPETRPLPLCAGEDWIFVDRLRAVGARKAVRADIVVTHVVPGSLAGFWAQRVGRGEGTTLLLRGFDHLSHPRLVGRLVVKSAYFIARTVAVIPLAASALRLTRASPRRHHDLLEFIWAKLLEDTGQLVGEWSALGKVLRAERSADR